MSTLCTHHRDVSKLDVDLWFDLCLYTDDIESMTDFVSGQTFASSTSAPSWLHYELAAEPRAKMTLAI